MLSDTPKQIYKCDYPDCPRFFVRQDLCARHRERHTTRGSNLQRKDNYISHPDQATTTTDTSTTVVGTGNHANELSLNTGSYHQPFDMSGGMIQSPSAERMNQRDQISSGDAYRSPPFQSPPGNTQYGSLPGIHRSNSDSQYFGDTSAGTHETSHHVRNASASYEPQRHGSFGSINAVRFQKSTGGYPVMDSTENTIQWNGSARLQQNNGYNGFIPQQHFPPMSSLPPPVFAHMAQNGPFQQQYYSNGDMMTGRGITTDDINGIVQTDSPLTDGSLPVFDTEGYTRSPVVMADNFAAWLFNDPQFSNNAGQRIHDTTVLDPSLRLPLGGNMPTIPPQSSMAVTSLLEPPSRNAILSESKRQQILELVQNRFNESNHSPVAKQKEQLLSGDCNAEGHVLSQRSLQAYINSYWYHFHEQMPILHRPTFSADKAQTLLLLAIVAIGAANLDKMYGQQVTNAAAELANFLAWHVRGELFMDQDFRPPAKLWVLQTLILLECYEKLYSSRVLHERSQIHHATTISLLRRGSALLGRSAMDSPPNQEEDKQSIADTPDPWWNHWITNEATKRVAYALFIIDSTHAIMFSHTAVMLAHEMRLPLPCDEALWSASSGMEVGRIESGLRAEGIKQISFLDGLKWTLNGKPVRTNRFGRTALMAGLLNVSFHLGQRDMQVRSLGVIGGKDVWRGSLTKAFDIWEADWNNEPPTASIPPNRHIRDSSTSSYSSSATDEDHVFESRIVLHHLAHMGMHVDIVQCQIYAKAKRLLGRTITPSDYSSAVRRMREVWAPKASARDAVFYSLKFLGLVLTPDISTTQGVPRPPQFKMGHGEYVPRDDYLLNRPWVVYFAALVVWSYGYALDGRLKNVPPLDTKEEQIQDMRAFMMRVGTVNKPDDLENMKDRNCCAGMLCFLGAQFKKCRWELMHEASILLGNCVDMLRGINT
jgi:hypothetical protein